MARPIAELKKEPFNFKYTVPSLDWYDIVHVEIKPDDYVYFKLSLRYGPSWWLVGMNPPAEASIDFRWNEKDIGRISERDIARFVEWAKYDDYPGCRLIAISAVSGVFDIFREVDELLSKL